MSYVEEQLAELPKQLDKSDAHKSAGFGLLAALSGKGESVRQWRFAALLYTTHGFRFGCDCMHYAWAYGSSGAAIVLSLFSLAVLSRIGSDSCKRVS